ncbi:hypothetical protein GA0061105_105409 [Rhizobium aethiopicum]|uniref:Uncharacterized protein n=1 Tax=Rhizobium aethiopicum TaxID=1138170 RepID=A0A1C3Y383_9HYPH|nr:hypothetical protein GA0061105_105409 [Rhizobium aethiopicum]
MICRPSSKIIAEWITFFVVENGRNITDDDFEVLPEKMADIGTRVLAKLDDHGKAAAFIKALGI